MVIRARWASRVEACCRAGMLAFSSLSLSIEQTTLCISTRRTCELRHINEACFPLVNGNTCPQFLFLLQPSGYWDLHTTKLLSVCGAPRSSTLRRPSQHSSLQDKDRICSRPKKGAEACWARVGLIPNPLHVDAPKIKYRNTHTRNTDTRSAHREEL